MLAHSRSADRRSPPRRRNGQIVLVAFSLLLTCCLLTSLVGNVGLAAWAAWSQFRLGLAQEQVDALRVEIDRLRQLLLDHGIEIPLSPTEGQQMDTIEAQVVALRGLPALYPVERSIITQDQLAARVQRDFEDDYTPQDVRDYALTLAAFDLIDPQVDLYDLFLRLYTEQIAGFYDIETSQIYVIAGAGPMGPMQRLTYAHEFVHALQDQHFDLQALGLGADDDDAFDSEYRLAVRALVEGDATLVERKFLARHLEPVDIVLLIDQIAEIDTSALDEMPAVLIDQLHFPYVHGLAFVQALYDEGGWDAVDAAYADPPRSTEQILHPDRYRRGDEPQIVSLPPLTDTLGAGWRMIDSDVLGEYFMRLYLARQVSERQAEAAAEGWGGDRYAVHHRSADDGLVLVLHAMWDTPGDAEEFVDTYVTYADTRFGRPADTVQDAQLCWTAPADALCLTWGPIETTIVRGPDMEIVSRLLEVMRDP